MKLSVRIILTAVLIATSVYTNADDLTANAMSVNITPPLEMKYTLGGYGERMNKPAESIHDSIFAKALVLKKGNEKFAVITIDILGLPSNFKTDLLKRISSRGWNAENIMLLPSHSHGSLEMAAINTKNVFGMPQIGVFQPELLEFLLGKMEQLLHSTDSNFSKVKVGTDSSIFEGLNRNRRGDSEVDRELTVTRIDRVDGKPLAVLVNWTAHPTFIDGTDMLVSAEWPGYLQTELEKSIGNGVVVMYYNGAEGDISPVYSVKADAYVKIQEYGKIIAEKALSVYKQVNTTTAAELNFNYKIIDLPEQVAHPDFMETGGAEYGLNEETVKVIMDALGPKSVGIGAVRIGNLVICGIPGEMAAGLGMLIKNEVKSGEITHVTIGGLANEWISYILTEDEYVNGGGYESSVSFYGPQLGNVITRESINVAMPLVKK